MKERIHTLFADINRLATFLDRAAIEAELREQYAKFNPTEERIAKDANELVCGRAAVVLLHAEKYLEPACVDALKAACHDPPLVYMRGDFWRRLVLVEATIKKAGRKRSRTAYRNKLIRERYELMRGDWFPGRLAREDGLITGQKVIERLADDFGMDHAAVEAVIFPKK